MKKQLILIAFLLISGILSAQAVLRGKVINAETSESLVGATIQVDGMVKSAITNADGIFEISLDKPTPIVLVVSYVGFATVKENFTEDVFGKNIEIALTPKALELGDVVVSATRSRQTAIEYPARIDVMSREKINTIPALSADELLRTIPGISVSRSSAFLSSSTVSLRGMGSEQGRTLVLVDGVPINKSDGGSVNWNALSINDIQRIEVVKGPGSSIYGGNAMGGIINMITPAPEKKLEGNVSQSYGTFDTWQTQARVSGKQNKLFWGVNGMYRTSDGYITTPADEVDEYSVASFLEEYLVNGRLGYLLTPDQTIELAAGYYSGKRGTGQDYSGYGFENDDLAADDGGYNTYDNLNGRLMYRKSYNESSQLNVTLYGQRENYQNIRESLRNDKITRYDVESFRTDIGLLAALNFEVGKSHAFTVGLDSKNGAVDGNDIYITSTDKVINRGKMFQTGLFVQDEITLFDSPWRILAGLRYDLSSFYDGDFIVEDPTNETAFLQDFAGELDDATFNAISPRLSLQYHIENQYRIYGGYSRGFRPAVLDDMCRTGRISGGMKLANPELKPEFLDNFEIGGDIFAGKMITISPSVYYSIGTDYHAYIATGDSLFMSGRMRPIRIKDNIGKVEILGTELAVNLKFSERIALSLAYSHIETEIVEYERFDEEIDDDLTGNALVYQPTDIFNASFTWENKFVNFFVAYDYKGAQWTNDVNTEEIEAYSNIDLQLWRPVYKNLSAAVKVNNVLDDDYVDSHTMIAPGRMITAELKYKF